MPSLRISGGTPYEQQVGYSRAVRIGNQVAVAGTTAMRDGKVVGLNDPATQTRVILDTIAWALNEAGASFNDVIRYRVYLTNIEHWPKITPILSERFGQIRPANTLIACAALVDPDMLVEIEADAIIGDDA